jgi:hypothetical protein
MPPAVCSGAVAFRYLHSSTDWRCDIANLAIAVEIAASGGQKAASDVGLVDKALGGLHTAGQKVTGGLASFAGGLADIGKNAVAFAAGGVLLNAPGALLGMAKAAAEDERATARLSQAIVNLGGDIAGHTSDVNQAIKAAQSLGFSDDQVRNSFVMLAAATGDSDEALKRQRVAMDLARGAGIPLEAASKLLGKVTEENVQQFKRLGITLKEGSSEAEAMAAVQAKFAGQADAYAQSTAGQFEAATLAMSEIQESIGSALLPVLSAVGKVLTDNLPAIQEFVGGLSSGIADTIIPAVSRLVDLGKGLFAGLMERMRPLLDVLPDIGTALSQAVGFFTTGAGDIETFRGVLNRLLGPQGAQMAITIFTNLSGFFRDTLMPAFTALGGVVQKVLGGDFGGALTSLGALLADFAPKLLATLADWGQKFVTWVAPVIPPLLEEAGKLATRFLGWLGEQVPPLIEKLGVWAGAFIDWVGPKIPPLLVELGKLAGQVFNWIITVGLPALLENLGKWAVALVEWVAPRIVPLLGELWKLVVAIADWWERDGKPQVDAMILKLSERFYKWVQEEVIPKIGTELGKLWDAIVKWIGDTWENLKTEAGKLGTAIVDGIKAGVAAKWDEFRNWVGGMLTSLVGYAKSTLRAWSPSRVWAEQVGEPIIDGIMLGIAAREPQLNARMIEVVNGLKDRVVPALDAVAEAGQRGSAAWKDYLEAAAPVAPALDTIAEAAERANEAWKDFIETQRESRLDEVADDAADATEKVDDLTGAMASLAEQIRNIPSMPSFGGGGGGGGGGGEFPGMPSFPSIPPGGVFPEANRLAAAGSITVNVYPQGSVLSNQDLVTFIRTELTKLGLRNGGLTFSGGLV